MANIKTLWMSFDETMKQFFEHLGLNRDVKKHNRYEADWIDVKSYVPNLNSKVLMTDGKYIYVGRLPNNFIHDVSYFESVSITHWMPLPSLPKL